MVALPDTLKDPIAQFLRQYYFDGLRFVFDGHELMPTTITKHGGSLLVAYNSSGNQQSIKHAVPRSTSLLMKSKPFTKPLLSV
jgi:hypothetical protein